MTIRARVIGCIFMLVAMLCGATAALADADSAERTLSPYFLVKSDSPGVDQLPLKSTSASVRIAGVIADVTVTQVYKNEGDNALEAIYVFPGSTRAAVYGMTMTIGTRKLIAAIREREQARRDYEAARQAGQTASLLEQQRPNVFQMNVANIMPGDEIIVELKYTELLVPTDGTYEFVYPTVVGPRYSNKPAAGAAPTDQFIATPYLPMGETVPYSFDLKVTVSAGMPIQDISCATHKVNITHDGLTTANVALKPEESNGGNRDFILRYQLAGGKIESGLLLYEGDTENFFLLMVQPPERVAPADIPPREFVFIVDVSGSMHGFPLEVSKKLLRDLLVNLRPIDKFNVVLFAGGSTVMAEASLPATRENIERAINIIDNQQGGGGTELLPALRRALALPRPTGIARTVVIATDGYVGVEREAFDLIRNNLGKASFFPFGIGSSVNRFLIEGMARMGAGEPFIVENQAAAGAKAELFRKYIESPVLTGVNVSFPGFNTYDVEPPSIPDVLAQRPIIVFGKWRGPVGGEVAVTGTTGGQPYSANLRVAESRPRESNSALRYLWARHRIAVLNDYNSLSSDNELKEEVTALGLQYNLMTQYTSFIAIDQQIRRNANGELVTVQQPLPLPQGVENTAVGYESGRMAGMARGMAMAPSPALSNMPVIGNLYSPSSADVAEEVKVGDTAALAPLADSISIVSVTSNRSELPRDRVRQLVAAKLAELLPASPTVVSGPGQKIKVKLVIGRNGAVSSVVVVESELDAATEGELLAAIRNWRFAGLILRQSVTAQVVLEVW